MEEGNPCIRHKYLLALVSRTARTQRRRQRTSDVEEIIMRVLRRILPVYSRACLNVVNIQFALCRHVDVVMRNLLEKNPRPIRHHCLSVALELRLEPVKLRACVGWRQCLNWEGEELRAHNDIGKPEHDFHHRMRALHTSCIHISYLTGMSILILYLATGCSAEKDRGAIFIHRNASGDVGQQCSNVWCIGDVAEECHERRASALKFCIFNCWQNRAVKGFKQADDLILIAPTIDDSVVSALDLREIRLEV